MIVDKVIETLDETKNYKASNYLVEAKYNVSPAEQKIIIAIASQVNKNGERFEKIRVTEKGLIEFCEFSEINHTWLKNTCKRLRSRSFYVKIKDEETGKIIDRLTGWINAADFHDGFIDFEIDERLKPCWLNLKEAYLSTKPKMMIQLKKDYGPRLYMLLKKSVKLGEIEYKIKDLISMFDLPKSYKIRFSHFKDDFIEKRIKEINEKTDIKVDHEFVKEGRAYTKIRFTVTAKEEKPGKKKKDSDPAAPKNNFHTSGDPLPEWAKDYTDEQKAVLLRLLAFPVREARELVENHAPEDINALIDYISQKYAPEYRASQIVTHARNNFIECRRARDQKNAASAASEEKPQEKDETPYDNMGDDVKKSIEEFKQKNKMFLKG